jgi:uncharacterized membrane protein
MEVFDILLVGIEASIALAGFAGVIATYQINNVTSIRRGAVVGLAVIVQYSLMAAVACAISLLLHIFGVKGETLWAISSVIGAIVMAAMAYGSSRSMRGAITNKSSWLLYLLLQGLGALVTLAMILNAVDLVFHREPGPFVAGVVYALIVAAINFSRLLLLPLWRIVREQEDANSRVTNPA